MPEHRGRRGAQPSLPSRSFDGAASAAWIASISKSAAQTRCFQFHHVVVDCGDEDDRQPGVGRLQPAAELQAGHPAELDIEHDAGDSVLGVSMQECFSRRISLGWKAMGVEQALDALPHAGVVFDDGHCAWLAFQGTPLPTGIWVTTISTVGPIGNERYWPKGKNWLIAAIR